MNAEGIDATTCTCGDGLDNDEDGWTDVDDPLGSTTYAAKVMVFLSYECNDGIDNDEDGTDSADILVFHNQQQPQNPFSSKFRNDEQDNEDGWIDAGVARVFIIWKILKTIQQ